MAKETKTIEIEVQISWWLRWIYWPIVKLSLCAAKFLGFEAYANENALLLLDQLDLSKAKCRNMVKAELNHYLSGTGNGGPLTIESELRAKK